VASLCSSLLSRPSCGGRSRPTTSAQRVPSLHLEDGRLIDPERLTIWFERHCQDAGRPVIRLHDARHSYGPAGLAKATGWHEAKVISERLGHANLSITIDTYSHVLPAADEATATTLASAILGRSLSS
jgi:integrase